MVHKFSDIPRQKWSPRSKWLQNVSCQQNASMIGRRLSNDQLRTNPKIFVVLGNSQQRCFIDGVYHSSSAGAHCTCPLGGKTDMSHGIRRLWVLYPLRLCTLGQYRRRKWLS